MSSIPSKVSHSRLRCMIFSALILIAAGIGGLSDAAAASAPVTVTNPKDIAKALGVGTPFGINTGCINSTGASNLINCLAIVPAGARLIIKNFSVHCFIPTGISVTLVLLTTITNGVLSGVTPAIPPTRFFDATKGVMSFSQPVETYADPGSKMFAEVHLDTPAPQNTFICSAEYQGQAVTP
jgi:hypothetical protein